MTIKLLQAWNGYAAGSILNTGDSATEAALVAQFIATYNTAGGNVPPRDQFSAHDLQANTIGLTAAQIAAGATGLVGLSPAGTQVAPDGSPVSGGGSLGPIADLATLNSTYPPASNAGKHALVGSAAPYTEFASDGSGWAIFGATTLRHVATSTHQLDAVHASNTIGYSRNPHFARISIPWLQIVLPGWRSTNSSELVPASNMTYTASIEYPAGTFTQVKFSGSATGVCTAGSNLISDVVAVFIPKGEKFWTRIWCQMGGSDKIIYFSRYAGDGTSQATFGTTVGAVPDLTMGGTATTSAATGAAVITPIAIISNSAEPAIGLSGDSIPCGNADSGDASCLQGYLERAFGGKYAVLNVSTASDTVAGYVAASGSQSTRRRALLNAYCTHIITNFGINDIGAARTAATNLANLLLFFAFFPGKRTAICTMLPWTSSTDVWVTTANQTVQATEGERLIQNSRVRNGYLGTSAIIDVERMIESSYMSGLWQVIPGSISPATPAMTGDGLHPNQTGYLRIAQQINTSMFV